MWLSPSVETSQMYHHHQPAVRISAPVFVLHRDKYYILIPPLARCFRLSYVPAMCSKCAHDKNKRNALNINLYSKGHVASDRIKFTIISVSNLLRRSAFIIKRFRKGFNLTFLSMLIVVVNWHTQCRTPIRPLDMEYLYKSIV